MSTCCGFSCSVNYFSSFRERNEPMPSCSVRLSICLSVRLSICLSVHLSICLSVSVCVCKHFVQIASSPTKMVGLVAHDGLQVRCIKVKVKVMHIEQGANVTLVHKRRRTGLSSVGGCYVATSSCHSLVLSERLHFDDHILAVLINVCSQRMYLLKLLRDRAYLWFS